MRIYQPQHTPLHTVSSTPTAQRFKSKLSTTHKSYKARLSNAEGTPPTDYSRSYRSPLLSPGWQSDDDDEDDTDSIEGVGLNDKKEGRDDVSDLPEWGTLQYSQRMLRSTKSISSLSQSSSKRLGIAKRPVKKVLSALPNLSSLRSPRGGSGSGCAAAYLKSINSSSSDYYEEETDCRDDDSEYLLGGMYDNLSGGQREFPSSSSLVDDEEEVGELGGMKSFKQLREVFERGGSGSGEDERVGRKYLEVVDFGGFDDSTEEDCSDVVLDVEEERDEYNEHLGDEEVVVMALSDKENDATDVIVESPRNIMKPMRMSTDDSLVGLNLSENSRPNKEAAKSIDEDSSDLCVSTSSSGGVVAEQQQQQPMIVNSSTDYRNQNSSFFGYSTCTEEEESDIASVGSSGSSSTCDLDSHLPLDDKSLLLGVSKLSPVKEHATPATEAETPDVESSDSGDSDPHQSHAYASYMNIAKRESPPVTVTPSENGDVILVTPMDDVMDIGLQPPGIKFADQEEPAVAPPPVPRAKTILADVRPSPALLIPSLGKHEEEEDEASLECEQLVAQEVELNKQILSPSTEDVHETPNKMESAVSKSTPPSNEASPTGVDELEDEEAFVSDEDEQFTEVDFATPATPDERSLSPIPAVALESAFIASKGWDDDEEGADESESVDDAASQTSSGFGPFVKYEDALSDILKGRAKAEMIELRPSLESDCGQSSSCVSSSVVSSSVAQASDTTDEQLEVVEEEDEDMSPNLLDMAVDSEELSSDDSKDATESPTVNEPGSFSQIYNRSFDKEENEESDSESEAPESDYYLSADSGETSDYIDQRTTTRPWAKAMDSYDSGEYESDLISTPSASMEEGDQGSPQSVPHILSGKVSDESLEESESNNNNTSLNTFWAHELEKELSHSVEEDDAEESQARRKSIDDNIHTDCDGNQYLKVYDLDSGEDIYEVIDQRHSLETVEECRTEEEEEADDDEDAVLAKEEVIEQSQAKRELEVIDNVARAMEETLELDSRHKSEKSIVSLEDLHSLFDQYSEVIPESLTEEIVDEINDEQLQLSTPPPSEEEEDMSLSKQSNVEIRSVRSPKKRHVHIKKRAIIKKANAMQKTKYDLAYLEMGSHHHENKVSNRNKTDNIEIVRVDSQDYQSSLLANSSLDEMVSKALGVLSSREKDVEDHQNDESSISSYSIISAGVNDLNSVTPTVDEESSVESVTPEEYKDKCFVSYESTMKKNKEDIELLEAELNESIKSMKSKGSDNSTAQSSLSIDTFSSEEKSHEGDIVSKLPVRGELKRGQSFIVAKLMDENHELAESLATTQSKLQKVKRKIERVTSERDRMISSARFEI